MEKLLVEIKGQKVFTDSLRIAEKFNKRHDRVIRKIENLIKDDENNRLIFGVVEYKDKKGEFRKKYIMDRRSFTILSMGFTGKKAFDWKNKFLDAFKVMEKTLLQQSIQSQNTEWIAQRSSGKIIHREKTDIIKDFIEYAKSQGGSAKGCGMYYSNIAKMENKALFILEQKFPNFRDILNLNQLATITSADGIAKKAIREGIDDGLHYKEIYRMAKNRVETFADLHGKTFIPYTQQIRLEA